MSSSKFMSEILLVILHGILYGCSNGVLTWLDLRNALAAGMKILFLKLTSSVRKLYVGIGVILAAYKVRSRLHLQFLNRHASINKITDPEPIKYCRCVLRSYMYSLVFRELMAALNTMPRFIA